MPNVHPILRFSRTRDVKAPHRANPYDAGIDFYVPDDFVAVQLLHGSSILIPSGVKVDVPPGWALIFKNKSGVASKKRLDVMACVVDHGYQGEVHISLINNGTEAVTITPGEKIVQGVMFPVGTHLPVEVVGENLYDATSSRGEGGFGSTG